MESLSISCVKLGNAYTSDYVNNLLRMVRQQSDAPFFCHTDNSDGIDSEVEVVDCSDEPFRHLEGWWPSWFKITTFASPELESFERKLHLDLDLIIHGDISKVLNHNSDKFTLINCTWKGEKYKQRKPFNPTKNSSVSMWKDNRWIYNKWISNVEEYVRTYAGTDAFYRHEGIDNYVECWDEDLVYSYRKGKYPEDPVRMQMRDFPIALFHQHPKNHELNIEEHPILEHWNGNR
jgi:hypothetical protein